MAYLGTPLDAVAPLRALVDAGMEVTLVVTGEDRRRGRGGAATPSPVAAAARELGLAVSHDLRDVADADVELGVVVAYGRLIPREVLEQVPMVNLHFSLLPRWRGAAPVEWALLAGDDRTGVCVMAVEEGLDTGGVYARAEVPIEATATAERLREVLASTGGELLVRTLQEGLGKPEPQEGEATYARKMTSADRRLDWEQPAELLARTVRIGGAWTMVGERRLKVLEAVVHPPGSDDPAPGTIAGTRVGTGAGTLELLEVQPEGRGPQSAASWRNGARIDDGTRLGERA